MSADDFALVFFERWYCENGCPGEIISDRDKVFVSKFWKALMRMSRVKHKLSTAYHPDTDGSSERSNNTMVQCLHYHVERNQKGWARALPKVCFDIMNTVDASTQVSPFVLKTGRSPRVLPPLFSLSEVSDVDDSDEGTRARELIERLNGEVEGAKDCLLAAKVSQAHHANKGRANEPEFSVGDKVMLETAHCRREYMQNKLNFALPHLFRLDSDWTPSCPS